MWIGVGKGKGGAGCTTSALEIAYAAARRRQADGDARPVAYLDLDPQAHGTAVVEPDQLGRGIKDVLAPEDPLPLHAVLTPTAWEGVLAAPASRYLANREADMTSAQISVLRRARLSGEIDSIVSDVIVDLPRDLGKIATAGLLGIEHLFIAARASMWGAQGAEEMRYTAALVKQRRNPELAVAGVIVTEFDGSRDAERVLTQMRESKKLGPLICDPPVPRRVLVRESIESFHTPCRDFGDSSLVEIADIYQGFYDRLYRREEKTVR